MEIPHDLTKLKRCHLTLQEWETLNLKGGKRAFPNLCSVDAQGGNSNHERLSHKSSQQWCHSQSGSVNSATQQGTYVNNNRVHMYTTTGYTWTSYQEAEHDCFLYSYTSFMIVEPSFQNLHIGSYQYNHMRCNAISSMLWGRFFW